MDLVPAAILRLGVLAALWLGGISSANALTNYTPYTFTTYAGNAGYGSADGIGNAARFNNPGGIAVDSNGTVYVADTLNFTVRKISAGGVVTTLAGLAGVSGYVDATGSAARFGFDVTRGMAVDAHGNVYVVDFSLIRKISPDGVVTTIAGQYNSFANVDGIGTAARFIAPEGLAIDASGNLYVADAIANTVRKITPDGSVTTLAGQAGTYGYVDGAGSAARFDGLAGVAVDGDGNIYVGDNGNNALRKITPGGVVTTLAVGSANGFLGTTGLAVDGRGNVYVASYGDNTIRMVTPAGTVTILAGYPSSGGGMADGTGSAATFKGPSALALDASNNLFVSDVWNNTIRKVSLSGVVTTFAGLAQPQAGVDGIGSAAGFFTIRGAAVDRNGNVYVADGLSNLGPTRNLNLYSRIRKIAPGGVVTTLAGRPDGPYSGDGSTDGPANVALFNNPNGVAVDTSGNVFVADTSNHTIRKITLDGTVSTLAGLAGNAGSADGTGSAARFFNPMGVAVDVGGNVYVGDTSNATIRKITALGVVTTLAGTAGSGGSSDGVGSGARFTSPAGLAVDANGNVFVAERSNIIRKITPTGVVTTLAGTPGISGSSDGIGGAALFNSPSYVAVDNNDNVYVADFGNFTVRKIDVNGVVTTLGGKPGTRGSADGTGGSAQFSYVQGIAVDPTGNLYVADGYNNTVRLGSAQPVITANPQGATINYGDSARLSVTASAGTNYQWFVNGAPISGATSPSFTTTFGGNYSAVVTNGIASATSSTASVKVTNRMVNLSTRAQVQSGSNIIIVGFGISGLPGTNKQILIRGVGPGLAPFNVSGALPQPTMSVCDSLGHVIASDTRWNDAPVIGSSAVNATVQNATPAIMQGAGAFTLPSGSADSALILTLPPGTYTVPISSANGATGIGLGEVYEIGSADSAVLTNVSARVHVGTDASLGISGFVVSGPQPATILIRGVGPALAIFGMSGVLAQPSLAVYDSNGKVIVTNTGWRNSPIIGPSPVAATIQPATPGAMQSVGAFSLPENSADDAVVVTLPPGAYTAAVSGVNGTTGIALVEIYQLKQP